MEGFRFPCLRPSVGIASPWWAKRKETPQCAKRWFGLTLTVRCSTFPLTDFHHPPIAASQALRALAPALGSLLVRAPIGAARSALPARSGAAAPPLFAFGATERRPSAMDRRAAIVMRADAYRAMRARV